MAVWVCWLPNHHEFLGVVLAFTIFNFPTFWIVCICAKAGTGYFLFSCQNHYPKAHSLPQTKKKYIYINRLCCSHLRCEKSCVPQEQLNSASWNRRNSVPCSLHSECNETDGSGDSEVMKPVDHHSGTESLPRTTSLVDRLVYFHDFIIIIFILMR